MTLLLAIAALMSGVEPPATTDHIPVVEINHFFDEHARWVFTQVIYYEQHSDGQQVIRSWRLVKVCEQIPVRGKAIWWDGNVLRKVICDSVVETWTQVDKELVGRETWPKEWRREMTTQPSRKRARELLEGK